MKDKIQDRLFKSTSASSLGLVARVLNQILIVPILIIGWSTDLFGEWLLLSTIPSFIALSDFGFIAAGSNELARRASQQKNDNIKVFYNLYSVYFQRWSIIFAIIIIIISFLIPFNSLMGLKLISSSDASVIFILLSLSALVNQNSLSLLAGLRIKGKFHIGLFLRAISTLIQILITWFIVKFLSASPLDIASLILIISLLAYIIEWAILKKFGLYQTINPFKKLKYKEPMKVYFLMGLEMMLMPIAQALTLQGAVILAGNLLGPTIVVIYVTHRTIARISASILQVFSNPLRAEAGMLQRNEDIPLLTKIVVLLSRITFWMSISISMILLFLGNWIFSVWTDGHILFDFKIFLILLLGVIAESLWRIPTSIRLGSNRHRPIVWGYLIFSIFGLLLANNLSSSYGVLGIASGILLVDILMMILSIWTLKPLINISIFKYILYLFVPPIKDVFNIINMKLFGSVKWLNTFKKVKK